MARVTFILPSLNVADYIEECVLSALGQTLKDTEILCIDAGSTDGTEEILKRYAADERYRDRIRILHSDIRSYGYQVNTGIRAATGEYVAILETDDYIKPDMAEKMLAAAEESGADMVRADYDAFYILPNGRKRSERYHMFNDDSGYGIVEQPGLTDEYYLKDQNIWRGIYKKEFLTGHDIWLNESAGAAYQDLGFVMQTIACAKIVVYLNESFYQYRLHRPGSSSYSPKCVRFIYQEYDRLLNDPSIRAKFPKMSGPYIRMIQSFAGEYEKAMIVNNYDTESENLAPYYAFFRSEAEDQKVLFPKAEKWIGHREMEALELLLRDPEEYSVAVREKEEKKAKCRSDFVRSLKNKKICIFGAGLRGQRLLDFLEVQGITVNAFADNDPGLWGEQIAGLIVLPTEEIIRQGKEDDLVILIANKNHETEIYDQLLQAGICVDKISKTNAVFDAIL